MKACGDGAMQRRRAVDIHFGPPTSKDGFGQLLGRHIACRADDIHAVEPVDDAGLGPQHDDNGLVPLVHVDMVEVRHDGLRQPGRVVAVLGGCHPAGAVFPGLYGGLIRVPAADDGHMAGQACQDPLLAQDADTVADIGLRRPCAQPCHQVPERAFRTDPAEA